MRKPDKAEAARLRERRKERRRRYRAHQAWLASEGLPPLDKFRVWLVKASTDVAVYHRKIGLPVSVTAVMLAVTPRTVKGYLRARDRGDDDG